MNTVEKNVSTDQQPVTQESASQLEELSPPDETTITSSLQAGINYCHSMAEQMVEEIKSLQEQYDSTRQTNRVLKQNLVDLENEKQKLIADFQEDFRKFNSLNSYVKELEEEILCLKGFLDPSIKLEEEITLTRIEELKIRSSILQAPLEEQQTKLQKMESSVSKLIEELKEKMDKVKVFNAEQQIFNNIGEQLKSQIDKFDTKIKDLTSFEDFIQNKEDLEKEINSIRESCSIQADSAKKKKAEVLTQIKMEFDVLRSREALVKDKIKSDFSAKQNTLDELKIKTVNKLNQSLELYREIKTEEEAIKNLENGIALLQSELCCLKNKLPLLEQEKTDIQEILNSLLRDIHFHKQEQSSLTEERENLEQNIEQLKVKEQTMQKDLDDVKDKIELNKKLTEILLLKDSSQEENTRLKNEMQQLLAEKENLEIENANLIREISEENERFAKLQNILPKNEVSNVLNNENESEVMDQLRLIKTEEYSLMELKEAEFDKMTNKFHQIFSDFTDLEFSLSQMQQDNERVGEEIRLKEKSLTIINQDNEFLKSSIQRIKQNVYNGNFITMQELSKRYNMMVNGKNVETERVDKLKTEIANLKARLSSKKETAREGTSQSVTSDHSDFLPKEKKSKK